MDTAGRAATASTAGELGGEELGLFAFFGRIDAFGGAAMAKLRGTSPYESLLVRYLVERGGYTWRELALATAALADDVDRARLELRRARAPHFCASASLPAASLKLERKAGGNAVGDGRRDASSSSDIACGRLPAASARNASFEEAAGFGVASDVGGAKVVAVIDLAIAGAEEEETCRNDEESDERDQRRAGFSPPSTGGTG